MQLERSHRKAGVTEWNWRNAGISRTACRFAGVGLLLAVLVWSPLSHAQNAHSRLGMPEVLSLLGSPLLVKIPIEATESSEEITPSRFSLGVRPVSAGIPFVENAEIGFERVGNNHFLVIRSRYPVNEPAIGIVIREQVQHGIRSREFSLLLDPPPATGRTDERAIVSGATLAATQPETVQSVTTLKTSPIVTLPGIAGDSKVPRAAVPEPSSKPRSPRTRRSTVPGMPSASADLRKAAPVVGEPAGKTDQPVVRSPGKRATKVQKPAEKVTAAQRIRGDGPKLRLSLDADSLNALPAASEEVRADLRRRQLILDTDDLTSALLERHHRIALLEKELVSLAARVTAAERSLNIKVSPQEKPVAPAVQEAASANVAATGESAPAPIAATPPATVETPRQSRPATVAPVALPATAPSTSSPSLLRMLMFASAILLLAGALFWIVRRHIRARDDAFRVVPQKAEDYVAEVLSQSRDADVTRVFVPTSGVKPPAVKSPEKATIPEEEKLEIQFELPPTPSITQATHTPATTANAGMDFVFEAAKPKASEEKVAPADDIRARRMRYLQSRYQDIAILKPPLDAPQRLLSQAGRIHDEGAAEFAKRLLKYAAYSRPHTDDFWLALLELLYREKCANDYLVNAKWFQKYHPQSKHWDEVVRIGYLLDPAEPLFAKAAAWSHDAPPPGFWLPVDQPEASLMTTRTSLKLELAN